MKIPSFEEQQEWLKSPAFAMLTPKYKVGTILYVVRNSKIVPVLITAVECRNTYTVSAHLVLSRLLGVQRDKPDLDLRRRLSYTGIAVAEGVQPPLLAKDTPRSFQESELFVSPEEACAALLEEFRERTNKSQP